MSDKTPAQELREIRERLMYLVTQKSEGGLRYQIAKLAYIADRIERDHRAIVLPEPRAASMCINSHEARGFNECLAMVKELNGVKS